MKPSLWVVEHTPWKVFQHHLLVASETMSPALKIEYGGYEELDLQNTKCIGLQMNKFS
jgi:hypothetical protein